MSLTQNSLAWLELELICYANRITPQMSAYELREALQGVIPGSETLTISRNENGNQLINLGETTLEVGPMASNDEIVLALRNPFIRTENTRLTVSAIDRLKAKALEARNVAPDAIKKFEADLDSIIAEKAAIETKRVEAISPHQEAIAGVKGELDGLKSAMDVLTNGPPV